MNQTSAPAPSRFSNDMGRSTFSHGPARMPNNTQHYGTAPHQQNQAPNMSKHQAPSSGHPTRITSTSVPPSNNNVPPSNNNRWGNYSTLLSNGLMFRNTARPDAHALYDGDRVIISRTQRGSTDKDRAKIREICTEAITPTITKGNIGKLLTTTTDEDYDIAKDATQWQLSLNNIWRHVVAYDFTVLVNIPLSFDPCDQHSVHANSILVNGVLDHDKLENNHYFAWQELIRRFALDEELLSNQWLEETLWKSLDSELRSEVQSNFAELPPLQKGGISLLRLVINRIQQ